MFNLATKVRDLQEYSDWMATKLNLLEDSTELSGIVARALDKVKSVVKTKFGPKQLGVHSLLPEQIDKVKFKPNKKDANLYSLRLPLPMSHSTIIRKDQRESLSRAQKAVMIEYTKIYKSMLAEMKKKGWNVEDSEISQEDAEALLFFVSDGFV